MLRLSVGTRMRQKYELKLKVGLVLLKQQRQQVLSYPVGPRFRVYRFGSPPFSLKGITTVLTNPSFSRFHNMFIFYWMHGLRPVPWIQSRPQALGKENSKHADR